MSMKENFILRELIPLVASKLCVRPVKSNQSTAKSVSERMRRADEKDKQESRGLNQSRFLQLAATVAFIAAFSSFVGAVSGTGFAHFYHPSTASAPVAQASADATALQQMGLDPNRLSYFYNGLDQKLVGVEGAEPIRQII